MARTGVDIQRFDAGQVLQDGHEEFYVFLLRVVMSCRAARACFIGDLTRQIQGWRGDGQATRVEITFGSLVAKADRRFQVTGRQRYDGAVEVERGVLVI